MTDSIVTVKGGPTALARAMTRTLENVQRAMEKAAVLTARWGVARMVSETAARRVDASAQFKRKWKVVKFPGGGATANTSPYAEFVERGRRPGGRPPVGAIEKWAKDKGLASKRAKKERKPKFKPKPKGKEWNEHLIGARAKKARAPRPPRPKPIRSNIHHPKSMGLRRGFSYGIEGGKVVGYRQIGARKLGGKRPTRARKVYAVKNIKLFAIIVARKIARKGTKAKWLLRDVLDDFKREAAKNYLAAVKRVARDPLGKQTRAA